MRSYSLALLLPLILIAQNKDDKPIPRNPIKNHTSKIFMNNKLRVELFSEEFVALTANSAALKGISATIYDAKGNSTIKAKNGSLKGMPDNSKQLSLSGAVTVESSGRVARTEQVETLIREKETILSTELPFSVATPEFVLNGVGMKSNEALNPISITRETTISSVQSSENAASFSGSCTGPAFFQDFNNGNFFVRMNGNGKLSQLKDGVERNFFADEIRALCQKSKLKTEPLYSSSWGNCRMESPEINGNCDEMQYDFTTGSFTMESAGKTSAAGNGYIIESKSIRGNSRQRHFHCPTRSLIRSQERNFSLESDAADGFMVSPPSLVATGSCILSRDDASVFAQRVVLDNNEVIATDSERVLVKSERGTLVTSRIRFFETGAAVCTGWNSASFTDKAGKISRLESAGPMVYSQDVTVCPMRCRMSSEGLYAEGNSAILTPGKLILPDGEFAVSDQSGISFLRMETDDKSNSAEFFSPQGCTAAIDQGTVYADVIRVSRPTAGKTRISARSVTNRCKIFLKGEKR